MANNLKALRVSSYMPEFERDGIDYVVASHSAGKGFQAVIVAPAAFPYTLTFADHGLSNMGDSAYLVMVQNLTDDTQGTIADHSSRTATSVSITTGTAADSVLVFIFGRLANQAT